MQVLQRSEGTLVTPNERRLLLSYKLNVRSLRRTLPKLGSVLLAGFLSQAEVLAAEVGVPAGSRTKEQVADWSLALSGAYVSDYNFRGISQSARHGSVWGSVEARYDISKDLQWYAGLGVESIDFPNRSPLEIDLYGGVRRKFGALSVDAGLWYYVYPGGKKFNGLGPGPATCANGFFTPTGFCNVVKRDLSFWEVFVKGLYAVAPELGLGGNAFYSPSWLNSGAFGAYAAALGKYEFALPWLPKDWKGYLSGELGRYWFGVTDPFYAVPAFPFGIKYPDYTTWNLGLGLNYKAVTLDLRYYDTTLSPGECNIITSDHTATFNPAAVTPANPSGLISRWCGAAYIAKISVDTTFPSASK
jgi:Bacterial protein of unknown function (Gcw_chp)